MSRDNPFPPRPDTLHKRITAILQDWYTAAVVQDDDSHGYVDVYRAHSTRHEAVDRVLDAVREGLLSDAAVEAAIGEMTAHDQQLLHEWTDDGGIVAVRPILAAALDAALDEDAGTEGARDMTTHITTDATEARLIRKLVESGGYTPDEAAREVRRAHHESQAFRDATEGASANAATTRSAPRRAAEDPEPDHEPCAAPYGESCGAQGRDHERRRR